MLGWPTPAGGGTASGGAGGAAGGGNGGGAVGGAVSCKLADGGNATTASTSSSSLRESNPVLACFSRPNIELQLRTCPDFPREGGHAKRLWDEMFKAHHYLDGSLHTAAHTDVLRVAGTHAPVGMVATITHFGAPANEPGRTSAETRLANRKMMREHRVVVLPAWQGLGVGPAMSDAVAATWVATADEGRHRRLMSTTTHPRFGAYRDASDRWLATSGNHKAVAQGKQQFSHEYVGSPHTFAAGAARRAPQAAS
jgi:GNAT superfamily N-acetyltransferase